MLHAWIDPVACRDIAPTAAVRLALTEGVSAVVLRARTVSEAAQRDLTDELDRSELPEGSILWAGDPDLLASPPSWCAGIHLAARMIGRIDAMRARGYARVGCSVHNRDELQRACGADFVTLSPVFVPRSKAYADPPLGLDGLAALRTATSLPIVALGGVTPERVASIARTGVSGVAALSPFCRIDRTEARALVAEAAAALWRGEAP